MFLDFVDLAIMDTKMFTYGRYTGYPLDYDLYTYIA